MSNGEESGLGTQGADQAIESQLEGTSQLNQDFAVGVERRKEQLKLETQITKELQLQFETTRKVLENQQETIVQLGAQAKNLADSNASIEKQESFLKNLREEYSKIVNDQGISKDLQEQINNALKDENTDLSKISVLMEKVRGEMEQTKDFAREVDTNFSKFSKTLGMTEDFAQTGLGKMNKFFIELKTGNTVKKVEMITKKFLDFASPLNVAANLLDTLISQVFELEEASIGFSKATGFAREFDGQMLNVANNVTMAGGSIDDASKSLGDLAKNMSNFSTLSETAMENLATLDFRLKQIGVNNASKMFDIFSRNLGKGADESERLTRDLILSGAAAGITASEMSANFETSFKDLAVNGFRATEVFKDLAAQAKAAGVAISDLTALGKDFDTFDKGAEKAAKLNAILGTQISHMKMLHMSDEQRSMEMIKQVKMAVGNFDALSRSEKLYIAQAIAGGDVAKAQRLINMNTSEYLAKKDQMAASAKTQEDLKNMTEQLVPITQKFQLAITKVALSLSFLIEPLVTVLNFFNRFSFILPAILVGLATYVVVTRTIAAIQAVYNGALFLYGLYMKTNEALMYFQVLRLEGLSFWTAITTAAQEAFNFSLITGAGLVLGIAAAIAYLIYVMVKPNSPPFYLIFGVVAIGVFLLGKAFDTVSPIGIVFGLVITGLALAMSLLFYMIGDLVEKMTEFVQTISESPAALHIAATGIFTLAAAMAALRLSTIGFRFKAFTGFAKSIGNMGVGIDTFVNSIRNLKTVAGEIGEAIGESTLVGTVDGGKSTVAIGKNSAIASVFAGDKLVVDIQMPEIQFPTPVVHIYLDGTELTDSIREVIMETL